MKTAAFFLSIGVAVLAGCSDAPDSSKAKQPLGEPGAPAAVDRLAETTQVIAYYFHGTIRCETCLRIEKQAREAIEGRFPAEMAEQRLIFKAVNYDQPENAHFANDFKLPCPSLVVVRQKRSKAEKWKLLGETWEHVENPVKFNEYVEGEVEKFLSEAK